MRIALASDIHLCFYKPENYPLLTTEPLLDSILILAGDIVTHDQANKTAAWWKYHAGMFKHILVCGGNHDYYSTSIEKGLPRLKRIFEQHDNIHYLDNQSITIDGVSFFGTTLWTDINGGNPVDEIHVKLGFDRSDFRCIENFSVAKWKALNLEARRAIEEWACNETQHKKVLITHHVPDMSLLHPMWNGSTMNAGFGNTGLERLFYEGGVDLICSGHTHDAYDKMIYNTRCVCNPMGYPHHEQEQVDSFKLKLIEL